MVRINYLVKKKILFLKWFYGRNCVLNINGKTKSFAYKTLSSLSFSGKNGSNLVKQKPLCIIVYKVCKNSQQGWQGF